MLATCLMNKQKKVQSVASRRMSDSLFEVRYKGKSCRPSSRVRLGKASQAGVAAAAVTALVNPDLFPPTSQNCLHLLLRPRSPSRRFPPTSYLIHIGARTESASWRPFRTKWPSTSPGQTRSNSRSMRNHSHATQLPHSARNPYKTTMRHLQQARGQCLQAPMLRLFHLPTLPGHTP